MRRVVASLVAVLVVTAAGCAHAPAGRLAVSDDGRAAIVGGQSWRAPDGVTFFERKDALHVVSLVPGATFDVAVPLDAQGRPLVPANAPFEVRDGEIQLRDRTLPPTAHLVETGQIYAHDDHFHVTHRWENPDWRALYRAREEGSELPAATRQTAAFALATLLDHRIPGASEEGTAQGLRRMAEAVSRARRAVDGKSPAKQIMAMVLHDFEILEEGATLSIEGKIFKATDGLRFAYCGDHFHVEDAGGAWAHPISLASVEPGQFDMPASMFFDVSGGTVATRAGTAQWKDMLPKGEIKLVGDRWFLTEAYPHPAFARLQRLAGDASLPAAVREQARRSVIEVLKLPLDVESDAAFRTRLAGIDARIEARSRELEAPAPAKRR
jgi:hypothetical protein